MSLTRTNVRLPTNKFVGRRKDLGHLTEELEAGQRLVNIVGAPGIGKTRFATELALTQLKYFGHPSRGGVWFCDLTDAFDVDDLCSVVGETVNAEVATFRAPVDTVMHIAEAIAARGQLLLVLDNFEQLAEQGAAVLKAWLDAAPEVRFIVTSRSKLRLHEEYVYELSPLGHEETSHGVCEAVDLFIQRAEGVKGRYEPTRSELREVLQIVKELEGNPLAIELAAARMRVMATTDIQERLSRRLDLLASNVREGKSRSSTLRGAIDWSWNLLKPFEQAALAQASVFRGGFSLDAAEAVVDLSHYPDAPWIVEVIHNLVEHSLLHTQPPLEVPHEQRFRCYESVREYAAERLQPMDGRDAARSRHAHYYVASAERWVTEVHGPHGLSALRRLILEQDNLLAIARDYQRTTPDLAAKATVAIGAVMEMRGAAPMHGELIDEMLKVKEQLEPSVAARLLMARARLQILRGHLGSAEEALKSVLEMDNVRPQLQLSAQLELASVTRRSGAVQEAEATVQDVLKQAQALDDRRLEAAALRMLAMTQLHERGNATAIEHLERSLALEREAADLVGQGETLDRLGIANFLRGQLDESEHNWEAALALHRLTGNRRLEAITLSRLGRLHIERGQLARARTELEQAMDAYRQAGDRLAGTAVMGYMALLQLAANDARTARYKLQEALAMARRAGDVAMEAHILAYLGFANLDLGRAKECAELAEKALQLLGNLGNNRLAGQVYAILAIAQCRQADLGDPEATLKQAEEVTLRTGSTELVEALGVHFGCLEVWQSKNAAHAGAFVDARALLASAKDRLQRATSAEEGAVPVVARSIMARLAARQLEQAIDECEVHHMPQLQVEEDGRWYQMAGDEKVDLRRRQPLRRLLSTLCRARVTQPGRPVSREALVAAGWPGERILDQAAAIRLRVALSTLRKTGLQEAIVNHADGYLIDTNVSVALVPADAADKPRPQPSAGR